MADEKAVLKTVSSLTNKESCAIINPLAGAAIRRALKSKNSFVC